MQNDKTTIQQTFKSADTEEWLDIIFYRRIGYALALLFRKMHVTPNAVTIVSIIIGAAAGVLFYYNDIRYNAAGILLLIMANTLDSTDGQLARMTGQYSRLGRILDGVSGDIWFVIIYFAIAYRLRDFDGWSWLVYPLGIAAGYSHIMQAAIADSYRGLHLYFLNGREKSEMESVDTLKNEYKKLTWKKNWFKKIVMIFYINYTRSQQQFSPSMRKLRSDIERYYPGGNPPDDLRAEYRRASLPLLKYTNILTFNTRAIVLFISLIINEVWAYYVFELTIMNILLAYMIIRYEKICRNIDEKIIKQTTA